MLYHQKPRHEPMVKWAERALLGEGILRPGEAVTAEGLKKGGTAERILSAAEVSVRRNATYTDKNQSQFLEVLRSKLAPREVRT